jgi:hypothetical protein
MAYTVEELEQLENKIWGIVDAAAYGGLSVESAVFQLITLLQEERSKWELEQTNNKS